MDVFKDKIVIITGGASGIGRALGLELARRGSDVMLADINEGLLIETADEIKNAGYKAQWAVVDVSVFDQVQKMVNEVAARHGRIDYLFNNAGIVVVGEVRDCSYEDWKKVIDVNLYGVVNGVVAAYPIMVKQGFGHIVNTSSLAGLVPAVAEISYTTSKYGIVGLSNALRLEAADLGVKVSVACPGLIDTPILKTTKVVRLDRQKMYDLLPKKMLPQDCAKVILQGVERNKATIVVTFLAKSQWFLQRLSPAFVAFMYGRIIRKMRDVLYTG
jgi:NAD(P)-dependent dehydrogenase (short-subunit alcohol dehydrogenase family)